MADREQLDGWVITPEGDTAKVVSPPTGPGFAVVCQQARALPERLLFALAESLVRERSAHPQQAEPVQFDPAEAMRLADEYASAQSELDGEHSVNRLYYVKSRNEARAKLAVYLGIKEAK